MADIFSIYMKQPVEYHLPKLEDQKEKNVDLSACTVCVVTEKPMTHL